MKRIMVLLISFFMVCALEAKSKRVRLKQVDCERKMKPAVYKKKLKNGLTILVYPSHRIPKVMVSMWYNVGSKDEKDSEKGIAHLIEHMIFKGNGETITEPDIAKLAHDLSASMNAATSYDYTNYYFSLPTHNWKEVMPVLADVMVNCSFDDQLLNSEMKAVIQELKMNRDNYIRTVFSDLVSAMFPDHPYHYPVIGFKQDLWHLYGKNLKDFYKKHYWPNNATLVITGDVNPEEVFVEAQKYLEHIEPNKEYAKESFYLNKDIASKSVTIYRDVQHPIAVLAFLVPGAQEKLAGYFDVLELMLGNLKSSRLYKKIVDEHKLASMIYSGTMDLFEHGVFYILFQPTQEGFIDQIQSMILDELQSMAQCGPQVKELEKSIKQARMRYYSLFEDINEQAQQIGKYFLSTGDESIVFNYLQESTEEIGNKIKALVVEYIRPTVMYKGLVMPLPEQERSHWQLMQQQSDLEDNKFLSARLRTEPLQQPVYSSKIMVHEPQEFAFPKANQYSLSNGIKVLYYHNATTPKIDIVIELKAKGYFDPEDKQGLYGFMTAMLEEGTENYSASELAEELDARGILLRISPGGLIISLLKEDLADGLNFALEVLTKATFPEEEIEKIRSQIFIAIKNFWDEPKKFVKQLVRDQIYKGHPWSKNILGSKESIAAITRDDLVQAYKKYISPDSAKIAIVGDLEGIDLKNVLEKTIGSWSGEKVDDIVYPALKPIEYKEIHYPIDRDQTVLAFAGLSVDRNNPDYDKLILFDQIFGQGALNSMHSKLFALREETGLFYTINGSTLAGAGEQPGMVNVVTIVSLDRLKEAEEVIKKTIDTVAQTVTQKELTSARHAIINALINNFESNQATANAFLFLDKYNLPADFFDTRNKTLSKITLQEVIDTVKKYLNTDHMITVKIGRTQEN